MPKEKLKVKEVSIIPNKGGFSIFKKQGSPEQGHKFRELSDLRHLFGNEKARMLYIIKAKNPSSIYELSKILERNFRAVSEDIKLLKKLGFIELKPEQTKKRKRLRPIIAAETLRISVKLC